MTKGIIRHLSLVLFSFVFIQTANAEYFPYIKKHIDTSVSHGPVLPKDNKECQNYYKEMNEKYGDTIKKLSMMHGECLKGSSPGPSIGLCSNPNCEKLHSAGSIIRKEINRNTSACRNQVRFHKAIFGESTKNKDDIAARAHNLTDEIRKVVSSNSGVKAIQNKLSNKVRALNQDTLNNLEIVSNQLSDFGEDGKRKKKTSSNKFPGPSKGVKVRITNSAEKVENSAGKYDSDYQLGIRYARGIGVEKDRSRAFKYFAKAAKRGNVSAQHKIGMRYYLGNDTKKDIKKAKSWIEKAANQGFAPSQFVLGLMYRSGDGVKKNPKKAFYLHKKAARSNHSTSQYSLGEMYRDGKGTKRNLVEAKKWFQAAHNNGHKGAKATLAALTKKNNQRQNNLKPSKQSKVAKKCAVIEKSNRRGYGNELKLKNICGRRIGFQYDYIDRYGKPTIGHVFLGRVGDPDMLRVNYLDEDRESRNFRNFIFR